MKLLIVSPSLEDGGGVTSFVKAILPNIVRSCNNVKILEIGSTRKSGKIFHPLADQIRFRESIKSNPDLIQINPSLNAKSFLRDGLFVLQAKKKNMPVVVFFHGWENRFSRRIDSKYKWFFNKLFGRADTFVVLANDFKKQLINWGINAPIYLCTTAVEPSLVNNFNIECKLIRLRKTEQTKILFLSRLEREKGIFETIDAFRILIDKGYQLRLTIAGDGSVLHKLEDYLTSVEREENLIQCIGYVRGDDKKQVFASHDIYCFPSYGEGLPTSVLEAMAFGMPILTRPVGGLADIFEDGKMGALVQSISPVEISSKLELLINDKDKLVQISKYNHDTATKRFMAPQVAENLLDIYDATVQACDNK